MKSLRSSESTKTATRYSRAFTTWCLLAVAMSASAISITWDNATPLANQTITGTEILVDGSVIGLTDTEQFTIDSAAWPPGDYTFTARHVGTRCFYDDPDNPETSPITCGFADVSAESEPLIYTVADSGVPGVAPLLRFHQLDGAAYG